ncbi:LPS export ABC transporter permease LptF [Mesobacterium sp. TK19101]|uniref:LPS export ABC transporter permease LptF n=1 Tax=Mesobacterium hydrothermale TaxID=3111907 RepID=A0ABU6HDU5_9RHOB|nr:LPS export ABC transporter permease LptF [Mesobacterium sp. TK19101]MEC3860638.1 LPS export ABC transporter permease LptF [Mesobacterium sp. TK19101]
MARFDRYVLSQLMVLFGFFALVLVSVYWVNRAVILFDRLIADGHSAGVFLEFTALSLPKVIGLVLPMAAFAAAVYVTNRLSNDSELTVVQATGFSPWRLSRPVFAFGVILMVMMSILTHLLIPASSSQLARREAEISGSLSARLLREGMFLHPTEGVTFYIRDITDDGELLDVYLSDRRQEDRSVTYTANKAYLLRGDTAPRLVMLEGMAQSYFAETERLATTHFSEFTYDVSGFLTTDDVSRTRLDHLSTVLLLTDPQKAARLTDESLPRVMEQLHSRFQQPLLCLVAALIGFSTLLLGGFSRFGVGRQIVGAIFLLVVVKLAESAVTDPVRSDANLWPLIYLPSVVGLVLAAGMLQWTSKPFRRHRPAKEVTA